MFQDSLRMNIHDTARTAKLLVRTTIVYSSNAVLSQCRGAHDARLDRDVQVRLGEDGL